MNVGELAADHFGRVQRTLGMALKGLTAEQLAYKPHSDANPIGWNAWHLTRIQDHALSGLAERDQAWTADGWHTKFDMPADGGNTGTGHNMEQVDAFKSPDVQVLLDYYDAVYARTKEYLATLTPEALDRVLDEPRWNPMPTVGVRLVSVMHDNSLHVGEVSYVRGLVEGGHWYPA